MDQELIGVCVVENDDALTIDLWPDAARLLGCGKSKVYELANTGRLPILRIGRKIRVLRKPLLRMLRGEQHGA
jgi:excisionase family DNA binding protein